MTHFLDAIKAQGMINVIKLIEFVTKDFRFMFYQNILIIFFFQFVKNGGRNWTLSNMVLSNKLARRKISIPFFQVEHHQPNPAIRYVA